MLRAVARVPHDHPTRRALLQAGTFAIAVYGGYFGAGLGIMLLAVMGLALAESLGTLSGLRNVLSILINVVAAAVFVLRGPTSRGTSSCACGSAPGSAASSAPRPSGGSRRCWVRALIVAIGDGDDDPLVVG